MSGVGPVEPGEGTHARDAQEGGTALLERRPRGRLPQWYDRHRRATLAAALTATLAVTGGYLYLTRPAKPAPAQPPYPSQVVDLTYLDRVSAPKDTQAHNFSFALDLSVESGPPVTVKDITQPYAGLTLTTDPPTPLRTRAGTNRTIVITMHVTQCRKVPESAGLPFLDVTLRNKRAIQVHSFILGQRYAQYLSDALQAICDPVSW